jgi:hypothetical protein
MTKLEYTQWEDYYNTVISKSINNLRDKATEYIQDNAPYPIGSIVTVEDCGDISVLRVEGYDIKNGLLVARFVTLEGYKKFLSDRAVVIE